MNGEKIKQLFDQINGLDAESSNLKRDNANINGDTPMGSMLQMGANSAKEYYLDHMIAPDIARLHREGWIHIHDLDFYGWTTTCTQIDLIKLFEDGFDTGHGHLRTPKSIGSFAALAAIAIQSNQNDQHGGQSIVNFDYAMARGVRMTYEHYLQEAEDIGRQLHSGIACASGWRKAYAKAKTERDTYQAMEGFIHNLNTMHSRAGAQVPFSSINYGMDTSWEGRMAVEQLLLATEAGLGNGETPIFPIQIYRIKEGVNYNPGDPNYDLFKLAMRVSAKRLFPNFSFLDAPFNLQYYDPSRPETEVSYMGAVTGSDVITVRTPDGEIETLPFAKAYERYSAVPGMQIRDRGQFVPIRAWQRYPDGGNWYEIRISNGRYLKLTSDHPLPTQRGRVLCSDLRVGDKLLPAAYDDLDSHVAAPLDPWLLGMLVCDGNKDAVVSVAMNERDLADEIVRRTGGAAVIREQHRGVRGDYYDIYIPHGPAQMLPQNVMPTLFGGVRKAERTLPPQFLTWSLEDRKALLAGIIDADGYVNCGKGCVIQIGSTNKALAIEEMLLAESVGLRAKLYPTTYGRGENAYRYSVQFDYTVELPVVCGKKKQKLCLQPDRGEREYTVEKITFLGNTGETRYDVTTESDRFDVSGLNSHNCRTRVLGNVHDPERQISNGRGNLSFTSINLPRLAIEAKGKFDVFMDLLDGMLDAVMRQLLDRFEVQCRRKARNFPFLMGQGVWLDSEKLCPDDEVGEVLKHGTLSIGFIGLAETLVALTGKHHGESEIARDLGLYIVEHMRWYCDRKADELKLNVTLLATPAESLAGRFVKIDRERYGIIPGVTDRDYYTNSFHVPVYFPITAIDKIRIEAPYHALTNAGHISYVELDGDPSQNLGAFEKIVRAMKEYGIGYGSINHPVDRDPVCGYNGVIGDCCPKCGRRESDRPEERIQRVMRGRGDE